MRNWKKKCKLCEDPAFHGKKQLCQKHCRQQYEKKKRQIRKCLSFNEVGIACERNERGECIVHKVLVYQSSRGLDMVAMTGGQ